MFLYINCVNIQLLRLFFSIQVVFKRAVVYCAYSRKKNKAKPEKFILETRKTGFLTKGDFPLLHTCQQACSAFYSAYIRTFYFIVIWNLILC